MAKLYFKYGTMGSSKTAQALITRYNYNEKGLSVWLIKPSADTRDGAVILRSRVGLEAPAEVIAPETRILDRFAFQTHVDAIIVDECQFMTGAQIDELRYIVDVHNIPVLCFGLRTDFLSTLFEGSRRLFEVADTISEIKAICDCGAKATTNARIDPEGYIVTEGDQLLLGGNDRYLAMCHKCWIRNIREHRKVK
jgi:thymidine kinase